MIAVSASEWVLILLNGRVEGRWRSRLQREDRIGMISYLRFARRAADLFVVVIGVLVIIYYFGLNPTAAIAGLGVGGIAVALAAQKTLRLSVSTLASSPLISPVMRSPFSMTIVSTLSRPDDNETLSRRPHPKAIARINITCSPSNKRNRFPRSCNHPADAGCDPAALGNPSHEVSSCNQILSS